MKSIKIPQRYPACISNALKYSENVSELDYLNNNYISNSGGITQIVSFQKANKNFGTIILQSFGT